MNKNLVAIDCFTRPGIQEKDVVYNYEYNNHNCRNCSYFTCTKFFLLNFSVHSHNTEPRVLLKFNYSRRKLSTGLINAALTEYELIAKRLIKIEIPALATNVTPRYQNRLIA